MKKISKFILKESAEILEKDEMKLIFGGGTTYTCCCLWGSFGGEHCMTFTHAEFQKFSQLHGANVCYGLGYMGGGCSN